MMQYRVVKNALTALLGEKAEGRFQVVGFQRQSKASDEFLGDNKLVQVYFSTGNFSQARGAMRGPKQHDISINIDLTASAPAEADISVLLSDTSTPQQKAAALLAVKEAAEAADDLIDVLIDDVWNIVMDGRNELLGLEIGDLANRWIETISKDTNLENGDLVVKTANLKYTCRVEEEPLGDIGNEPDPVIFDSSATVGDTDGAGVIVENENTEE